VRDRGPGSAPGHRARAGQEGSLTGVRFVGSYPTADFQLDPVLPEIAVIGRSNVGKSSLINALTGRRALARTSQTPGKTRLCNVFAANRRYYLVDLPGYGWARASRAERAGLARLLRAYVTDRGPLTGVVWLLDIRHPPSPDDARMGQLLGHRAVPVLAAITKADKVARGRRADRARAILAALALGDDQCVITSVRTREGIGDLRESIEALVSGGMSGRGGSG
jgi:GTP-binding protein